MEKYDKQFINGKWIEGTGSKVYENINPFTQEVLYKYRSAGKDDIENAFKAAKEAQKAWAETHMQEKTFYMERLYALTCFYSQVMDECLLEEAGAVKPKRDHEVNEVPHFARYYMTYPYQMTGRVESSCIPDTDSYIFRHPKGVITVFAEDELPFSGTMKIVLPAVALGNTVVVIPSGNTPASASIIGEMFDQAGFPDGIYNVLSGIDEEMFDHIISNPYSDMIVFQGSLADGIRIKEKTIS